MKDSINILIVGRLIVAAILAIVAAILVFDGNRAWGFFLFASVVIGYMNITQTKDDTEIE